jgi:hypothetical protein
MSVAPELFKTSIIFQGSTSTTGEVTAQKVADFQAQIRTLRNELVTLKDQLSKLRQESSKHQTRADDAEKRAAESARSAASAGEEFEKQKAAMKQVN